MTIQSTHDEGLVIVPAGAGAGKTHRIKTQLSDWVRRGLVRPERVLAVTFTEAAASELRERIRSGLLADGLVEEALAVERAYISTIHGLGLRILTEHALAAGTSPQPRQLGEAERDLLIRQTLAHASSLSPIRAEPKRFGYVANWLSGETIEASIRNRVLTMIDLLRGLGDAGRDQALIAPALERLDRIYGPTLTDEPAACDALAKAVSRMLAAFPQGGMAEVTASGPRSRLECDLKLLQRIARQPELLETDWDIWQSLRSLFTSNSRSKTPSGYDDLAVEVMSAADALTRHPGPLRDAKLHLRCLIACAQEVMDAYAARKRSLGLIDFADMIDSAERLLRTYPHIRDAVLGEVDCVIIDEFQDTSPVQFAMLWHLGSRAKRTLLVGDVKQSIMGFQGADARLSGALAARNPAATQPLDRNWRSTPEVMQFVNALGAGLFGAGYHDLMPTRQPSGRVALEVLNVTAGRQSRKYSQPQEHLAEHVAKMLVAGEEITDRRTGGSRPVTPSDIAVLVCRHSTASRYAHELRQRGIPVRIAEDGWSASPVVVVARAALSYAANPSDTHAALVLRVLGPDPLSLGDALTARLDDHLDDDGMLRRLADLSDTLAEVPMAHAVGTVLHASGIRAWSECQANAEQARADLLRLEAEAAEFDEAHRDMKAASGFHGETIKVFLGWLSARSGERDHDRRPDPSAEVVESVEIVTWHSSKGREWPVTVVAEFDYKIEERAWTTSNRFASLDRVDDMAEVLASAALIHTPGFCCPEATRRFIDDRRNDFEANARNLLYVAMTRARDRLVLEWPGFLKDREADDLAATRLFHILEDACGIKLGSRTLTVGEAACPAKIVDLADVAGFTLYNSASAAAFRRFGDPSPRAAMSLSPWRLRPSGAIAAGRMPAWQTVRLGAAWPERYSDAVRGTALHLALRTYLCKPELASALPAATGLDADLLARVAERANALKGWLASMGFGELHCEIPVFAHTPEGAEASGTIDLIAVGSGRAMIIDHKSGGSGEGIGHHWPQLNAYVVLAAGLFPDTEIIGAGIAWVDHGVVEFVKLEACHA